MRPAAHRSAIHASRRGLGALTQPKALRALQGALVRSGEKG